MCPLYDYKCQKCEYIFEEIHSMEERTLPCENPCPNCNSEKTVEQAIISAPGVSLGYQGSSVQSGPKVRRFQEEVLKPIKRGLGKSGRVKGIE